MTKTKQKRNDILIKRDEVLIDRDNVNAKREKIINLLDKTMINEINAKKNDDVKFKLKKKKMINFKIVTTANEKNVIIKKKFRLKTIIFICSRFSM